MCQNIADFPGIFRFIVFLGHSALRKCFVTEKQGKMPHVQRQRVAGHIFDDKLPYHGKRGGKQGKLLFGRQRISLRADDFPITAYVACVMEIQL